LPVAADAAAAVATATGPGAWVAGRRGACGLCVRRAVVPASVAVTVGGVGGCARRRRPGEAGVKAGRQRQGGARCGGRCALWPPAAASVVVVPGRPVSALPGSPLRPCVRCTVPVWSSWYHLAAPPPHPVAPHRGTARRFDSSLGSVASHSHPHSVPPYGAPKKSRKKQCVEGTDTARNSKPRRNASRPSTQSPTTLTVVHPRQRRARPSRAPPRVTAAPTAQRRCG